MNKYLKQPKGCCFCEEKTTCPDAFSDRSQYCGNYDHTETGPGSTIFGKCQCGTELDAVWFTEKEKNSHGLPTGRVRRAVDFLECPHCGKRYQIDSCYDEPWHYN